MNVSTCLITGLPGSGKSLLAIEVILANANSDSPRPLFTNIKGADHKKLRSFQLDNSDIPNIRGDNYPKGSIFVIDEAQEVFPPTAAGSKKTPILSLFETRRHYGYDFILVTQHPMLIHKNLRLLLNNHYHNIQPFGLGYRKVLQWSSVNEHPEPNHSDSDAVTTKKKHDKKLFDYYKSSSLHVKKKTLPMKPFITIGAALLVIICSGAYAVSSLKKDAPVSTEVASLPPSPEAASPKQKESDDEEFIYQSGFVASIYQTNALKPYTEIVYRMNGEIHYLSESDYAIQNRTVNIYKGVDVVLSFKLPRSVDVQTLTI